VNVFLMHPDRDVDLESELPSQAEDLIQDLELDLLLGVMARRDPLILSLSRRAILLSLVEPEGIVYRQQVLADCLDNAAVVRELYRIAGEALEAKRHAWIWWSLTSTPEAVLHGALRCIEIFVGFLRRLHKLGDEHRANFRSPAFMRFFEMISDELDEQYLRTVEAQLKELKFRRGVLVSARLGEGNSGTDYVLRQPGAHHWRERGPSPFSRSSCSFEISPRDDAGGQAIEQLRGRGVSLVANALAQSADHITGFFNVLMSELAFYVGCLNLSDWLDEKGEPACFPQPLSRDRPAFAAEGLYDLCLSTKLHGNVVGNDLDAEGKALVVITGANQGGKSTFLRSVGLAQLMMQSGMLVPARAFRANVCDGVFTHFKREEDPTMKSGKFDEELSRMSRVAKLIRPTSLLLCNESFASTNEREGSEIGRQVLRALTEAGVKVFFVTHLFDLAHGLFREGSGNVVFLRAERRSDGSRTFRLGEGEPLPTSYGADSYRRIFAVSEHATL
jgi:MutS domain V